MPELVYVNGAFVPRSEAKISVGDHGFLYGYGVFQSLRSYNGKLFLLDKHLKLLYKAAEVIGMRFKLEGLDLEKVFNDIVKVNNLKEARVRLTVTNGENPALPWSDASGPPNIVASAVPYTPFPPEKYEAGFKIGIASLRRMKQSVLSSIKSVNYLLNVIVRMEAAGKGWDETLLLNDVGFIAEGGGSNVFFVKNGGLLTPPPDSGIIPGVTREVVMELAAGLGIKVEEKDIKPSDLGRFNEAFMTNSMMEIMPVVFVVDEKGKVIEIGDGKPGAITRRLMAAYKDKVAKETA
ncbi:MAG TPA: aminotransferase class IV [Dehalococcoidales bacterium]|nr:aminotransferase class IV [Dehalococcoidales bacterium]